ncbi:MAG: hypothetical protein ACNA76_05070 [Anaerosomatales bacterium]
MEDLLDAYAAGLIDGEGTVTLSRNHSGKMRSPVISMTSTTPEVLRFMQERYGGSIRPYLLVPEKIRRADLIIQTYKSVTPRNGKYDAKTAIARHAFELEFFHPSTP